MKTEPEVLPFDREIVYCDDCECEITGEATPCWTPVQGNFHLCETCNERRIDRSQP